MINNKVLSALNQPLQLFLNRHSLPDSYLTTADNHFSRLIDEFVTVYTQNNATQIIGINGCQGSGKSTLADYLCTVVSARYNLQTVALSLDDFYLTKAQRLSLSEEIHPLLSVRGVPGTHDINLAIQTINSLVKGNETYLPHFNKSIDDRISVSDSTVMKDHIGLIVIEGWCFGAAPVSQGDLLEASNDLEQQYDTDGVWRQYVNNALGGDYQTLFSMVDRLVMLAAPSFDSVFDWRLDQEQKLAESIRMMEKGVLGAKTMNEKEISHFIGHFQRITEHCLLEMPARADHLYKLNSNRSIRTYNALSGRG